MSRHNARSEPDLVMAFFSTAVRKRNRRVHLTWREIVRELGDVVVAGVVLSSGRMA